MKKNIVIFAGLAIASAAFAQVNPTRPMVTGRGNVDVRPARTIKTNQTATAAPADETIALDKLVVTGSIMKKPADKVRR